RELGLDRLGELPRLGQVRRGCLHPEQVGVGRVGQPAGDRGGHAVAHPEEALRGSLAGHERPVALVHVAGDQRGGVRVRAGGHQARPAADVGAGAGGAGGGGVWVGGGVGVIPPPGGGPPSSPAAGWSPGPPPAAPAAIMAFISSSAFSTPPKPATASATMGASQYVPLPVPSDQAIWSARSSALLIRRTTCGTELTG